MRPDPRRTGRAVRESPGAVEAGPSAEPEGSGASGIRAALAAADAGRMTAAIELIGAVLAVDYQNAEAQFVRGLAELGAGDAQVATASLRRALYVRPNFWQAAFKLGRAQELAGDRAAAAQAYRRVLSTLDRGDGEPTALTRSRPPMSRRPAACGCACWLITPQPLDCNPQAGLSDEGADRRRLCRRQDHAGAGAVDSRTRLHGRRGRHRGVGSVRTPWGRCRDQRLDAGMDGDELCRRVRGEIGHLLRLLHPAHFARGSGSRAGGHGGRSRRLPQEAVRCRRPQNEVDRRDPDDRATRTSAGPAGRDASTATAARRC